MPGISTPPETGRRTRRRPDHAVVNDVRRAFAKSSAARQRRPGRSALVRLTGGTAYQVRRAIAILDAEQPVTTDPASTTPANPTSDVRNAATENPVEDQVSDKLVLEKPIIESSPGPPSGHRQNGARPATTPIPAPLSNPGSITEFSTALNRESPTGPSPEVKPAGDPGSPPRPPADARPYPQVRPPRAWPLGLIGLAAAVAVWGGWVDLGRLTGFGMVQPLPGLVDGLRINTAIVLPIGIEAYGGYALRTWLSSAALSAKTRRYAGWSALASLVVGAGAQVASHLMKATGITVAPWGVTVVVSCVPVVVLGLATGLATLVRQDTTGALP
jgi:hypothetical protein